MSLIPEDQLLAHHLKMPLGESGISEEVIAERGYRSVTKVADLRRLGFADAQCRVPLLWLPFWGVTGEQVGYAARPDEPRIIDGRVAKYEYPKGSRNRLDVPPRCRSQLGDPSIALHVTEGIRKGDAIASAGGCVIDVGGVWNWLGTNELGGKTALADWDSVALKGRHVRLVFDSDSACKPAVAKALVRLKRFIESRAAIVEIIYLPDLEGGAKQGVDDYLANGGTLESLTQYASRDVRMPPDDAEDPLPTIVVNNRHLREISQECWQLLVKGNGGGPRVFQRAGRLCQVSTAQGEPVRLVDWERDDVVFYLDRLAEFVTLKEKNGELASMPSRVPDDVVRDLMVAWNKPLPVIRGVVGTPIFGADGRLVVAPGYQEATQLYYEPPGLAVPEVPERPSEEDVERAKMLLTYDLLGDFIFADEAGLAHALAAALTSLAREMIDGPTPLFCIDAPAQGSGKGLLADCIAMLVSGAKAAVMVTGGGDDEMRKRITAVLRDGGPIVLLDNVKHILDSAALAAALTSTQWADRVLGKSQTIVLPNRALWLATGNNLRLDHETARRSVWARLDAKMDRPSERTGFLHDPLIPWLREHRHELVWTLLVLIQHWLCRRRSTWDGRAMGSFESWSRVVGGILQAASIDGFLRNRDELHLRADTETAEWRAFVTAWWENFDQQAVSVGDLFPLVRERDLLPSVFMRAKDDASERALKTRLGVALAQRRDRRFGDLFLRDLGTDGHQKGARYRLEPTPNPARFAEPPTPEREGSAEVPPDNASNVDSEAECAEPAEPPFLPSGKEYRSIRQASRQGLRRLEPWAKVPRFRTFRTSRSQIQEWPFQARNLPLQPPPGFRARFRTVPAAAAS